MTDPHPDDLTIVDLDSTARRALIDARQALHALIDMAGPDAPDHVRQAAVWIAELIQDNAALVAALSAALQVAIAQRDALIDSQVVLKHDLVATIAENMNWTHDTARQVLALFLNSDEQLLADDVAVDSFALSDIRAAFSRLDIDIEHVIETD